MARSAIIASLLLPAAVLAASPASAQFPNIFDTLFGNPQNRQQDSRPPETRPQELRPPADVPSAPPSQQQRYIPPPGSQPPGMQGGLPPGPPPGRIQMQPLPPPPGTRAAPASVNPQTPPLPPPGEPPQGPSQAPAKKPPAQGSASLQPGDEVVVEPPPHRIPNPTAVFAGLDKITGRIISFDVAINETVRFGALEVTPRACYTRPPTEAANTDGFIEVDELTLQGELRRIFTGWMFAASPGLSAVEHPIYDIWLTDCKGAKEPAVVADTPPPAAPAPAQRPAQRPQQRRATQQLPPPPPGQQPR